MCKFKSGIILKDRIYLSHHESHTDLLEELKIKDTTKNAKTLFVRAELFPKNGDIFSDQNDWVFNVDQDILPDWFVKEFDEQRMRAAVREWCDIHILISQNDLILSSGYYYLKDCTNIELNGEVIIIKMIGNSKVQRMDGNSTVRRMYGNSTVQRMDENSTVQRMYENSTVQRMDENSTVQFMDENSTVYCMYGNSTVRWMEGSSIVQFMYEKSTVRWMSDNSRVLKMCDRTTRYKNGILYISKDAKTNKHCNIKENGELL